MTKHDLKRPKNRGPDSMDCKERESHAPGVYSIQYTSRMRTARGGHRHNNNSKGVVRNLEVRNMRTEKKSPKQGLTSAADLTMMLPKGRDSPYHR